MKKKKAETWAILGGGILGQALALSLRAKGKRVTLIEKAPNLGGLTAPWKMAGLTFDKFYHVILPFDDRTLALLDDLGLTDEIEWRTTRTGFFTNGRLVPLNTSMDYLKLPVIGMIAKVRLALLLIFAARIPSGDALDKVPAEVWLRKWCGDACFTKLWLPLLKAKLGSNHKNASAAFIWASIRRLYLARKGTAKTEQLGFVRGGGYARIMAALREKLDQAEVKVATGTNIERILRSDDKFVVKTAKDAQWFDRVVSTLPPIANANIFEDLGHRERQAMNNVLYQGVICATLILDRPLGGYYLTYLADDDLPFTGIIEMTSLTGTVDGKSIVYLPRYVPQDDPYWDLCDDAIEGRFLDGLRGIYPDLQKNDVVGFGIARARQVMAVPTVGYRDQVPPVDAGLPGVYFVNSAQILDGTLNVDATLGVLESALPKLLQAQRASEEPPTR